MSSPACDHYYTHAQPGLQTRQVFGDHQKWRRLEPADWHRLNLPNHLVDQVFEILILARGPARFFELKVSRECPKETYTQLVKGLKQLGFPMLVVSLVHGNAACAHLILRRDGSSSAFHHLDINLHKPSDFDQKVMAFLKQATPYAFKELFRLLDGSKLNGNLFETLQGLLGEIPTRSLVQHQALVDLMLKLVFLIFVQRKGWLNMDPNYLGHQMERCRHSGMSILRCFLIPLFARLEGFRKEEPLVLGELPQLGGGLFEFNAAQMPRLNNEWLQRVYEVLVSRYSFSLYEAGEDRNIVGVSPEVLGHVFENLLDKDFRKRQGTFYTPMHIARDQAERAFAGLLERRPKMNLKKIRILDPSCGSGTYLVAAYQVLLQQRLKDAPDSSRYNGALFKLKKEIVEQNLYGIDISPMAIRLAEVRLWLNMIQDLDVSRPKQAPPLPNLQHHLRPGDFLMRSDDLAANRIDKWPKLSDLKSLRARFPRSLSSQRGPMLRHIRRLEQELYAYITNRHIKDAQDVLRTTIAQIPLPGFEKESPEIPRERYDAGPLLHCVFSDVFLEGGFDLILGNPPWLASAKIPKPRKNALKVNAPGPKGLKLNGHADLALFFVAAALPLLKPKGGLHLLLPDKVLQAQYSKTLRDWLHHHYCLDYLLDYGVDQGMLFNADTFPLALGLTNQKAKKGHKIKVERHGLDLTEQRLIPQSTLPNRSGIWVLKPAAGLSGHTTLAEGSIPIRRGMVTNAKRFFVYPTKPERIPVTRLRQLIRGRDLKRYTAEPGAWIYWPFDLGEDWWKRISDAEQRMILASGKAKCRYGCFHLSYKRRHFKPWMIIWKYLATSWTPTLIKNQGWIPDQTTYYMDFTDFETAFRYYHYFNQPQVLEQLLTMAERGKDRCYFFYAHTIGKLPIPHDLLTRPLIIPKERNLYPAAFIQDQFKEPSKKKRTKSLKTPTTPRPTRKKAKAPCKEPSLAS